jgi:N-hydroxyarylamine O-acetyltransferase
MDIISNLHFKPNLSALFQRFGIDHDPSTCLPTVELLTLLQNRFMCSIPFENLNLHFKTVKITDKNQCKVDISPEQVEKKFLQQNRGGYCFELNQYFYYVARELGYHVTPVPARVLWMKPRGSQSPRSHFVNIITFPASSEIPYERQYLWDVAFGPPGFVNPLRIDEQMLWKEQSTDFDTHRVIPYQSMFDTVCAKDDQRSTELANVMLFDNNASHYLIQVKMDDGITWENMYLFHSKEISTYADWYCANWRVATMSESLFVGNVYLCFMKDNCKLTLFNSLFTIRRKKDSVVESDGKTVELITKREILTKEEYLNVLKDFFNLPVKDDWKENLLLPFLKE